MITRNAAFVIALAFILLTTLTIRANSPNAHFDSIDSLKQKIKTQSEEEKLKTVILLMNELAQKQPDEAIQYFPEAIRIAQMQKNKKAEVDILIRAGLAYNSVGKFYDQIKLHEQALDGARMLGDSVSVAKTLSMLSMAYWSLGQYDKALEYQLNSLSIRQNLGDNRQILGSYNNLGIIYQGLDKDNEALECYLKALNLYDDEMQLFGKANMLNNIGSLYSKLGKHDPAINYYNQALELNILLNDTRGQAINYVNLGIEYTFMKKYSLAKDELEKSLLLNHKINDQFGLASAMKQMATVYDEIGDNQKALIYIDSCSSIAATIGALDMEKDILWLASYIYERSGNLKKALEAYKKHAALRDSIFSDNQMKRINELQARFDMTEKERANQLLQQELELKQLKLQRKQDQQYLMAGLILVLIVAGTFIFLAYRQKYRALLKQKELNRLKSRFISTVSHEFRTPLAGIYSSTQLLQSFSEKWSIDEKGKLYGKIYDSIMHLKKMLDEVMIIDKGQDKRLEVSPVVIDLSQWCRQVVEDTISAYDKQVDVNIDIENSLNRITIDKNILQHILTNLLSNAIKYSGTHPSIDFKIEKNGDDLLNISISDNGIGIDPDDLKYIFDDFHRGINVGNIQGTGLGMSIVKNCVELVHGTIRIESNLGKGTSVFVTIPYSSV